MICILQLKKTRGRNQNLVGLNPDSMFFLMHSTTSHNSFNGWMLSARKNNLLSTPYRFAILVRETGKIQVEMVVW